MSIVVIPGQFGIGYRISPYVQTDYFHTTLRHGVRIANGNQFERLPRKE